MSKNLPSEKDAEIRALLHDQVSCEAVARATGCSPQSVRRRMRQFGFSIRKSNPKKMNNCDHCGSAFFGWRDKKHKFCGMECYRDFFKILLTPKTCGICSTPVTKNHQIRGWCLNCYEVMRRFHFDPEMAYQVVPIRLIRSLYMEAANVEHPNKKHV